MPRTPLMGEVARALRLANLGDETSPTLSRRQILQSAAAAAMAASPLFAQAKVGGAAPRIAIIGGGLAGLACADRLRQKGYVAQIYDANSRLGGRCWSLRGFFPGQVAERGGELIDGPHKAMLAYANRYNLAVEDVKRKAGDVAYHFMGQKWPESELINQLRAVVDRMQPDLRASSGAPTYYTSNQADRDLDNTDLATYLASRCQGYPLIQKVLDVAYNIEYGLETSQQSSLNFLLFIRLNKRSKFQPFGVSNERYHIAGGNDLIVQGLESDLASPPVMGAKLTRLRRNGFGEFEMFFNGSAVPEKADFVVLTMPFTVLRDVVLEPSLGLSTDKIFAIDTLGYGTNAKCMVGFDGRIWNTTYGASGEAYSDQANFQSSWETNRVNSGAHGVITDFSGGNRGASLSPANVQAQVSDWLNAFDAIYPGAKAAASKSAGNYVAHLEPWPSNPLTKGSYTCYKPGQFTTVAGLESEPAQRLKFGGEHTDSFYSWQGYMEGACLSGLRAADEVLGDIKAGR